MQGRALPSVAPTTQHFRPPLHSLFAPHAQKSALSFQSPTHSSQSNCRDISNIFLALRTHCPKQPGVGVASPAKNPGVPLTPTKSLSFINVPRNSHGIYLFLNTHPATSFESYSFVRQGCGGSKLLQSLPQPRLDRPTSPHLPPTHPRPSRLPVVPIAAPARFVTSLSSSPHGFAFRTAFALHPAFCYRRRRRGKTFDVCK